MSERAAVSNSLSIRKVRGESIMETKIVKIKGKDYKLQRMGNLEFIGLATKAGKDPEMFMGQLIMRTTVSPELSIEDLNCMEIEEFYTLLQEVMKINHFEEIMKMSDALNKLMRGTSKVPPMYVE